jgi:hypothetical protein
VVVGGASLVEVEPLDWGLKSCFFWVMLSLEPVEVVTWELLTAFMEAWTAFTAEPIS